MNDQAKAIRAKANQAKAIRSLNRRFNFIDISWEDDDTIIIDGARRRLGTPVQIVVKRNGDTTVTDR